MSELKKYRGYTLLDAVTLDSDQVRVFNVEEEVVAGRFQVILTHDSATEIHLEVEGSLDGQNFGSIPGVDRVRDEQVDLTSDPLSFNWDVSGDTNLLTLAVDLLCLHSVRITLIADGGTINDIATVLFSGVGK